MNDMILRIARDAFEAACESGCENGGPVGCFETWPDDPDSWCRSCGVLGIYQQMRPEEKRLIDSCPGCRERSTDTPRHTCVKEPA